MVRRASLLLLLALVIACGRSGYLDGRTDEETPTPSPLPTPAYFGSGDDGPLVTSSSLVVNECETLLQVTDDDTVRLGGPVAAFEEGDLVLLWQVQGTVNVAIGDTASALVVDTAGFWELTRVDDVVAASSALTFVRDVSFAYRSNASARAQACRVPEFTDVTVLSGGRLAAPGWNGTTGGFVGFFASGTLTLDTGGRIGASSAGFRPGLGVIGAGANVFGETTDAASGGAKGEGIDRTSFGLHGRGHLANGAGGGNANNSGGGGGGSAGRGGYGGMQHELSGGNPRTSGRPGRGLPLDPGRIWLGGGGGAGHHDNQGPPDGGRGGGVALVVAREILGEGLINASGSSPGDIAGDGAGGGGGGGTVLLYVEEGGGYSGRISVRGGNGANSLFPSNFRGPGGGGGGGRVALHGPLDAATVDTQGGFSGVTGTSTASGIVWNAEPGEPGVRLDLAPFADPDD